MFIDTGVIKEELECEVNAGKGCIVIDIGCIYNSYDSELRSLCILDNMVLRLLVDGKELYDQLGVEVVNTYGYITKNTRIEHGLQKEHYVDARCISGNPAAKPLDHYYFQKKVRCHNRQIHKNTILKGGIRKRNQAAYEVKGFRLYDQVLWKGQKCFIFGRRSTGRMDLRLLDGTHINASVGYKNLKLLSMRKNYLIEQKKIG